MRSPITAMLSFMRARWGIFAAILAVSSTLRAESACFDQSALPELILPGELETLAKPLALSILDCAVLAAPQETDLQKIRSLLADAKLLDDPDCTAYTAYVPYIHDEIRFCPKYYSGDFPGSAPTKLLLQLALLVHESAHLLQYSPEPRQKWSAEGLSPAARAEFDELALEGKDMTEECEADFFMYRTFSLADPNIFAGSGYGGQAALCQELTQLNTVQPSPLSSEPLSL